MRKVLTGLAVMITAGIIALGTSAAMPTKAELTDCYQHPVACGFAGPANTGPGNVKLKTVGHGAGQVSSGTGWSLQGNTVVISQPGTVLKDLYIPFTVEVDASNVTVTNDRIVVPGNLFGVAVRNSDNVVIKRNDIHGNAGTGEVNYGIRDVYGNSLGLSIRHNNIWHFATGISVNAGEIIANYIHDPGFTDGDHTNGTTDNGSNFRQSPLLIQDNYVTNNLSQTDAISLFEDFSQIANVTINHNLVAGGGYAIYGGSGGRFGPVSNVKITNNRFSAQFFSHGGFWGPWAYVDGVTRSGNVWDHTGVPIG